MQRKLQAALSEECEGVTMRLMRIASLLAVLLLVGVIGVVHVCAGASDVSAPADGTTAVNTAGFPASAVVILLAGAACAMLVTLKKRRKV